MDAESHDSRLKNRQSSSPDDETERSSKRHKHRHRHHHHRHRSKKHEDKSEREGEDINLPPPPVAVNITRPDDDVEEGEILEEEGFGGGEHEIVEKRLESDDESGEIKSVGVRDESDNRNLVCSNCPYRIIFFNCDLLSVWLLRKHYDLETVTGLVFVLFSVLKIEISIRK
jgi:serine/threonine-protein kinase PRP4